MCRMHRLNPLASNCCGRLQRFIVCLALVSLIVPGAVILLEDSLRTGKDRTQVPGAVITGLNRGYFRTGQWRADARTLVAAARWCLEPDFSFPGNPAASNLVPALASTNAPTITRT